MSEAHTPPAGEQAERGVTPISEALADRHEPHREVGEAPSEGEDRSDPAPAQPAPAQRQARQGAQPAARQAASPPNPAPGDGQPPAVDYDELAKDPKFQEWMKPRMPKWAREHVERVNRERRAPSQEQRQPPPQAAQPAAADEDDFPDPIEDPAGYRAAIRRETQREIAVSTLKTTLTVSERFARSQHGHEAFEDCRSWLTTRPDIERWALQQPDPWGAAFTTYSRERLAEEIGDDPNAWREAERARIREELEAEFAGEQHEPRRPAAAQPPSMRSRPPPPASDARSAAPRDGQGRFMGPTPMSSILKNR